MLQFFSYSQSQLHTHTHTEHIHIFLDSVWLTLSEDTISSRHSIIMFLRFLQYQSNPVIVGLLETGSASSWFDILLMVLICQNVNKYGHIFFILHRPLHSSFYVVFVQYDLMLVPVEHTHRNIYHPHHYLYCVPIGSSGVRRNLHAGFSHLNAVTLIAQCWCSFNTPSDWNNTESCYLDKITFTVWKWHMEIRCIRACQSSSFQVTQTPRRFSPHQSNTNADRKSPDGAAHLLYCWSEHSGLISASLQMELWLIQIRHIRFELCSLGTTEPG